MFAMKPVSGVANIKYIPVRSTKFMDSSFPSLDMRNAQITTNPNVTYSLKNYDGSELLPGTAGKIISINLENYNHKENDRWVSGQYPMSIRFNNAYKVGDISYDIIFDVVEVKSSYTFLTSWDLPFLCIPNNSDLCGSADMFPWTYGYETDIEVTLDIGVVYHGDDRWVTSKDFYLACGDLDVKYNDQRYPESIWLREGFTGDIYLWEGHFMDIVQQPNWDYPWFCATNKQLDTGFGNITGDDSWYYCGFIAPLSYGYCRSTYYTEGCGTYVVIGCNLGATSPPVKSADQKDYYDGDTLKWNIVADIYEFYYEGFSTLDSFQFKDTLQSGQVYKSARVLRDGVDISNKFDITYNPTTRELSASCKASYLNQESFYDGKQITLEITCEVDSANVPRGGFLPNEGTVLYDGTPHTTTTKVPVKYKLTTSYEGQGSISEGIDNIPDGGSCQATYAPAENWCLQKLVIDGTTEITGNDLLDYLSKYSFENVHADHHVHAVFVPNYKITIEKKVDPGLAVFGEPWFQFEIKGTDVFGKSHVWHKQIKGSGSKTWIVPQGTYTVRELPVERYSLSKITGKLNCDNNGVCTIIDGNAHVVFENLFDDYSDYGHNDSKTNNLK